MKYFLYYNHLDNYWYLPVQDFDFESEEEYLNWWYDLEEQADIENLRRNAELLNGFDEDDF